MLSFKQPEKERYRLLFLINLVIFLLLNTSLVTFGDLSKVALFSSALGFFIFAVYGVLYAVHRDDKVLSSKIKIAYKILFLACILNLIGGTIFSYPLAPQIFYGMVGAFDVLAIYFVLFMPVFFLVFFGTFLYYYGKKFRKIAYIFFAFVVVVMLIYYFSGYVFSHYKNDDELFIIFADCKLLFHGVNPYNHSVAPLLYQNYTKNLTTSVTLTTNNQIVGTLNYPALFLFSFLPFYFTSQPTLQNLTSVDLEYQAGVLVFILIFVIAFSIDKKFLSKPMYTIMFFVLISFAYVASVTSYLMLALLVIAYVKLDSKYSWVFLGLCVAIQEELWLPVIFLIAYSFNNNGTKKGVYNVIGTAAVFLAINSYFILLSPSAFFHSVLTPLQSFLLPNSMAPFGYLLEVGYGILLSTFSRIFDILILFFLLVFVYFNKKLLVGLFGMLPLAFLSHAIPVYFTFFAAFIVITLFVKEKKRNGYGYIQRYLRDNIRLFYAALVVMVVIMGLLIYQSHCVYVRDLNISFTNVSIHYDKITGNTFYNATIRYRNLSNNTMYVLVNAVSKHESSVFGALNQSIMLNQKNCGENSSYTCFVNRNELLLNSSNSTYEMSLVIPRTYGNEPVFYVRPLIYNGNFYYLAPSAYNTSISNN